MKNLELTLITGKGIYDIIANRYDWDFGRGEGIILEIRDRYDFRDTAGGVISSLLTHGAVKNLSGKNCELLEYEKVILVARAYTNPEFYGKNNQYIITTDNYENLIVRNISSKKIREEIKRRLYIFFTQRPTTHINGLSLYCSLNYDISDIRDSLAVLKEVDDIEIERRGGTWDSGSVDHWHQRYRIKPEAYKEMEDKFEREPQVLLNNKESAKSFEEKFDFFICHASEDKEPFVNELASALKKAGFKIWYDDFIIVWGDSLREKIDGGLKASKYGIVILSSNFIKPNKKWAHNELNALFSQEQKRKKILPVWHDISESKIKEFSPLLLDRKAIRSSDGIDNIIEKAKKILKKKN